MVTKLLVVSYANSYKEAYEKSVEFIEGCSSIFSSYSIVKLISESNEIFENFGYDTLALHDYREYWLEEFANNKSEGNEVSFEQWLKSKKYLLDDINSIEEVKELAIEIASQHLKYTDASELIAKVNDSDNTTSITYAELFKLEGKKERIIDYRDFKEYCSLMEEFEFNGIKTPNEFDIFKHSYFPANFGLDQIAHVRFWGNKDGIKQWITLTEIDW